MIHRELSGFSRVRLAHLPTPLEEYPRLAQAFGVRRLWIKRDDCTGLALGGSKVRQLEYLLGEALDHGATTLIAHGAAQSNFIRLVAAAGSRLGLRVILLIDSQRPNSLQGNLLLDEMLGAEIQFLPDLTAIDYAKLVREYTRRLHSEGERCYALPLGGASPCGALGYVGGMLELQKQMAEANVRPDHLVVPVGTGGTLAGLMAGSLGDEPFTGLLTGIGVSEHLREHGERRIRLLTAQVARLLKIADVPIPDFRLALDWIGDGYGIASQESWEAVRLVGRTAGILFDPIYTGKALAGMRGLLQSNRMAADMSVVFWHTGGTPTLFVKSPHGC